MRFRALLLLLIIIISNGANAAGTDQFWTTPQYGGNSFNRLPPEQPYFDALRAHGATWVRLGYDKWKPAERDFLIGNVDDYRALSRRDLDTLTSALDRADKAGLKVVLVPLSLPFMRWLQNNDGQFDGRLWQDKRRWKAAARFWRDLAAELKHHPSIAAYNIINEPAPEKKAGLAEHAERSTMKGWYAMHAGGSRDLRAFYQTIIKAIREVDPSTPIMVDSGWHAAADAFEYWPAALDDEHLLYSFHMYEPYETTSSPNLKRAKPFTYPGVAPFAGRNERWDRRRIAAYLQGMFDWAEAKGIPSNRIVAGEFGCIRMLNSCATYLDDVLTVLDRNKIHWAFYSFREDSWDAMDYELGKKKVPWAYWKAIDEGLPDPVQRSVTPEFEPIRRRLSRTHN